jgi:outer membrane protein
MILRTTEMKKERILTKLVPITIGIGLFFFAVFAYQSDAIAQQRIWTLEDCINYAIENNIQIKQSELAIETIEADLLQSKLNLLPNLNASTNFSWSWGRTLDQTNYFYYTEGTNQGNMSVDANMTLFNGLQNLNQIKQNKIEWEISQYNADKMRDDISLMLTRAYLQILFNKELLKVAQEQAQITKEQIDRTAKMVEAGTLARGSLLEMEAQGAREELSVINYENQLDLSYLDLLQILDLEADADIDIEVPELTMEILNELQPLSNIYETALMTQPIVKSAELEVESSQRSLAIAKGGRSPVLGFGGGWGTNYSNNATRITGVDPVTGQILTEEMTLGDQFKDYQREYVGFNLSIPIFNGYQASTRINQAKIYTANSEYNLELTKNTLRKEIETAYSDAKAAYKSYIATQSSLSSFEESFRYTEQKFNVGLSNSVDYNIAKSQLTSAESELIRAKFDYIFKTKILDFYMGLPLTLQN